MNIRLSTERAYKEFIAAIASKTTSFNIGELLKQHQVDIKFKAFLRKYDYIKSVDRNNLDIVTNNIKAEEQDLVLDYFKIYRDEVDAKSKTRKEILKGNTNQTTSNSHDKINGKDIVTLAAKYANMGIKYGVTNLEGFIVDMIKDK